MPESSIMQRFRLDGRVVLVTGASGHLGSAIARAVTQAGGVVVLAGRSAERLAPVAADIAGFGGQTHALVFDVGQPQACRDAVARLADRCGSLGGIVNCAYGGLPGTVESARENDFDLAFQQNLTGPFALIQAALPLLRASAAIHPGGAAIVNIASMYGHVSPDPRIYGASGKNNPPYYGASKAALLQLTRYLAAHLGPDRIRVNSVSPGPFPPPAIAETSPVFHAHLCEKTPLGRIGVASEVAGPVVFLLSEAAAFVTGADLAVDGGWTAW